jgi:hypothetical protein
LKKQRIQRIHREDQDNCPHERHKKYGEESVQLSEEEKKNCEEESGEKLLARHEREGFGVRG